MSINIEEFTASISTVEDLGELWKLDEILKKQIRKAEKSLGSKKKKAKDPNAPKKEASPQLLEWNKQIHRIVELSGNTIKYNNGKAIASALKEEGKLVIKKDDMKIPTDKELRDVIKKYVHDNPDAVKKEEEEKTKPKPKAKTKKEEEAPEIEKYSFILTGKTYNRADVEGKSYLWKEDGTFVGAFNEKTKKIDTTAAEPK